MLRALSRLPLLLLPPKPSFVPRCGMNGTAAPIFPKFISLEDADNTNGSTSSQRFRIVSYNILAQAYIKSSFFPHSPRPCLKWKARSQAVLEVLKSFNSDFLCLQELDELERFYKGHMETHGYLCVYIRRTGQKRDGCGIFYKPESAKLLLKEEIEYNDLVRSVDSEMINDYESASYKTHSVNEKEGIQELGPDGCGNQSDPFVRLKRDCVGLLTAFKLKTPCQHVIIIANTHIYWDPELIDVKLAQVDYLLLRLAQFKEVVAEKFKCAPSLIIVGDFNSTPGDKVYQRLLSQTNANSEAADVGRYTPLSSLYASIGGEPPFTNCTPGFTGTLDYIFFSNSGDLRPVSFLEVPGPDSEDVLGGLPNYYHPSDHLPIGADFEVIRH